MAEVLAGATLHPMVGGPMISSDMPSKKRRAAVPPVVSDNTATARADRAAAAGKLVVERGRYAGKIVKLSGADVNIGRSSKCELCLKGSEGVSRRHCTIAWNGEQYVVEDLGSRNGTIVNGSAHASIALNDGDVIEVVDEFIRFVWASPTLVAPLKQRAVIATDINTQNTALFSQALSVEAEVERPAPARDTAQTGSYHDVRPTFASAPFRAAGETSSYIFPPSIPKPRTHEPPPLDVTREHTPRAARSGWLLALLAVGLVAGAAVVFVRAGGLAASTRAAPSAARPQIAPAVVASPVVAPAVVAPTVVVPPAVVAPTVVVPPAVVAPAVVAPTVVVPAVVAALVPVVASASVDADAAVAVPTSSTVMQRSKTAGVVSQVLVRVGQTVSVGTPLVALRPTHVSPRKLQSLMVERRDFATAAAAGNATAKRELVATDKEIARLKRTTTTPIAKATTAGTVTEVLVAVDDGVDVDGALVVVQPKP